MTSPTEAPMQGESVVHRFEGAPSPVSSALDVGSFVVACCPIRSRAWAVRKLWGALAAQTRPPEGLLFVEGDSTDETAEEINALVRGQTEMPLVYRFPLDTGSPHWSRDRPGERYTEDQHASLARVYNAGIAYVLGGWPWATHIWMIDSDVEPAPDVLELLLAADVSVVAAAVRNSPGAWNFMRLRDIDTGEPRRTSMEEAVLHQARPAVVALVSACVLYRREVLEAGCRFAADPRSHDFGMMAALRAAGYNCWVEPRARAAHWYYGPEKEPPR